jgi:uncharacterized protein YehS (DUF1456 family)
MKSLNYIAFFSIVDDMLEKGIRFFVLDSLTKIFGNAGSISRYLLDSFLDVFKNAGATFIVLHHLNGEGQMYGSNLLISSFDEGYIMEKAGKDNNGHDLLKIAVKKARYSDEPNFWVKRRRVSEHIATHDVFIIPPEGVPEQCEFSAGSVKEYIRKVLLSYEGSSISREKLLEALGENCNIRTVTNNLIQLEKEGFIKKEKSRSWEIIIILK